LNISIERVLPGTEKEKTKMKRLRKAMSIIAMVFRGEKKLLTA